MIILTFCAYASNTLLHALLDYFELGRLHIINSDTFGTWIVECVDSTPMFL